ncbi:MAG: hypothetical protein OSB26_12530 [Woeseiaceae bacterium]|nr:hypothetical protein [Woeseiaceae bacterium]
MPHQIIEFSENLESMLDTKLLIAGMHKAAVEIDGLPLGGLRTRVAVRNHYEIADQSPDNAFVHLILKLGHGRTEDVKQGFGDRLFPILCELLEPVSAVHPLAISFEIQEIHPKLTWKQSNLREHMAKRNEQD